MSGTALNLQVDENQASLFVIYPNPASDILNVAHNFSGVTYNIYTIDGKLVKSGPLEGTQINISEMSKGLYLLQLNAESVTQTKKIIKK
jgi:hypothetical protein